MKNIGILGCSMITPVSLLAPIKENETLQIYGIAGRNYDKAQAYAKKYNIQNVYVSYEALLADENIDIVYIPLANHVHTEWIIKSAKAKKHILVEKPICLKSEDLKDIEKACKANGVCLIEGIMARHHQWQGYIKELIDSKVYGKLKHIQTNLVFEAPVPEGDSYRTHMACGGGIFWDIASYWIQFLQEVLGLEQISTYEGTSKFDGPNGCDWDFDAKVSYKNGVTSSLHGAFAKPYEADYIVIFEEAEFRLKNVFRPTVGKVKLRGELIKTGEIEKVIFPPSNYYSNQLIYLNDVLEDKCAVESIEEMTARIKLLEGIYQDALKRRK